MNKSGFKVLYDGNSMVIKVEFSILWHIVAFLMAFLVQILYLVVSIIVCSREPSDSNNHIVSIMINVFAVIGMLIWLVLDMDYRSFTFVVDKGSVKVLTNKESFSIPLGELCEVSLLLNVIASGGARMRDNNFFICFSSVDISEKVMRKKLRNAKMAYYTLNKEGVKIIALRCGIREGAEELYGLIKGFLEQA